MQNNNTNKTSFRSSSKSFSDKGNRSEISRKPKGNFTKRSGSRDSFNDEKLALYSSDRVKRSFNNENSRPERSFDRSRTSRSGGAFGNRGQSRGGRKVSDIHFTKFINKIDTVEASAVYNPKHTFNDFDISPKLKQNIVDRGYVTPSPIQDMSIPVTLTGSDIVGIANTGTGKTAAFLIPLIDKVIKNNNELVLVVVPTRELAIQIEDELKSFVKGLNIHSVCCVGGASIYPQIKNLKYKNNFIIGTPGRLKDLIERKCIDLKRFNTLVMDEADQMLDMGFVNDMKYIVKLMPSNKHTLFFSATLSKDIEKIINDFLNNPKHISVKTSDTSKSVDQDVVKIGSQNKIDILVDLLSKKEFEKVLVFGRTKHGVERLSRDLIRQGFKSESIHGDKNHNARQRALKNFKDNYSNVLIATDVAARGLDIPNVSHVINFDIPATYEDYTHRIGRTGRGGKLGKAITFV